MELSKEEQDLFDQMRADDGAAVRDDAAKAAAEKAAQEAAGKAAADKAAAEKAAAEKAAADKAEGAKKGPPPEALNEARAENRILKKELEEMKKIVDDGNAKVQQLIKNAEAKADQAPDFTADPAAHLKHENEQLKKDLSQIREKIEKQETSSASQQRLNEHAAYVSAQERQFATAHADYFQAAEFVAAVWRDEFLDAGFKPEEVPKLVFGKSLAITSQARQAERDPAEAIYKIAKRFGFAAPQKGEVKDEKKADGESKLKQIEKGIEAAKGAGGGSGPDEETGLAGLAQLDDAELEKRIRDHDWWNKNIRRSPLH